MPNINNVLEFISVASKNRIYPPGTADGYKAAVKMFDAELNEEERESLNIFLERFDKIYSEVVRKNQAKMKMQSLETYKIRVRKVIDDYMSYGQDPSKMISWNRPARKRASSGVVRINTNSDTQRPKDDSAVVPPIFGQMNRVELSLRPEFDVKALIIVPFDLSNDEASRLKGLIDALVKK